MSWCGLASFSRRELGVGTKAEAIGGAVGGRHADEAPVYMGAGANRFASECRPDALRVK
jgi:hypothetical protein